jgi:hypothetical protein
LGTDLFECKCIEGYSGVYCAISSTTTTTTNVTLVVTPAVVECPTCLNGGLCTLNTGQCSCPEEYAGVDCALTIAEIDIELIEFEVDLIHVDINGTELQVCAELLEQILEIVPDTDVSQFNIFCEFENSSDTETSGIVVNVVLQILGSEEGELAVTLMNEIVDGRPVEWDALAVVTPAEDVDDAADTTASDDIVLLAVVILAGVTLLAVVGIVIGKNKGRGKQDVFRLAV